MKNQKENLNKLISNSIYNHNKQYALIIGETPSNGARSPKLWNRVYKKLKYQTRMYPADVKKEKLEYLINYLRSDDLFIGSAVTAPYKELIVKYLDFVSVEAKLIGSINTIKKVNKKFYGFNTDYNGILKSLNFYKNKKKILILGCGGAGKAVILASIKKFRNSFFYFFNRDKKKLSKFINKLKIKRFEILDNKSILTLNNIDLVINSSSIGFNSWIYRKNLFFNLRYFLPVSNLKGLKGVRTINKKIFLKKNKILINKSTLQFRTFLKNNPNSDYLDIIYNPLNTKLLKLAKIYGHKILNGIQMNFEQAVEAFCIVNNKKFDKIKKYMKKNG